MQRGSEHVWLVASISDALGRLHGLQPVNSCKPGGPTSNANAGWSTGPEAEDKGKSSAAHAGAPSLFGRPCGFRIAEGRPSAVASVEASRELGRDSMDFSLKRQQHQQQQQQHASRGHENPSQGGSGSDALDDIAGLLSHHILPRVGNALTLVGPVVAAQQHALQQLERAGRWVGARRIWPSGSSDQQTSSSGSQDASDATTSSSAETERLARLALHAQAQSNPELAATIYSQLVEIQPSADNYARLSKQLTDMTYMPGIKCMRDRVVDLNRRAVELAGVAVDIDSSRPLGHIARCVSRGRLALLSDNRTKVQLAKDAADDAATALKLDPNNDLAHHLMGRWHYEMAQINAIARTLIRIIFGTSLMQGSYTDALHHFQTAAQLCPVRVIHRVEVGRTLMKLGDKTGAMRALEDAIHMEVEDINADLQQKDAALMLRQLQSAGVQGLFYNPRALADQSSEQGPRPSGP